MKSQSVVGLDVYKSVGQCALLWALCVKIISPRVSRSVNIVAIEFPTIEA